MGLKLEFNSIKNYDIFKTGFENLKINGNNIIEFKKQPQASGGIAVVYAPNGTGKSSLTALLGNTQSTEDMNFEAVYNNKVINSETKSFHIIGDQISRNVIEGETSDYLIGKDIKNEYKLKKKISEEFQNIYGELNTKYKKEYGLTKVTDYLLNSIDKIDSEAYRYIRDIVNKQSKGKNIDRDKILMYVQNYNISKVDEINQDKKLFILQNINIIQMIMQIKAENIKANANVEIIEQNIDAINILDKYKNIKDCIVCDNRGIKRDELLKNKKDNKNKIYNSLDKNTKKILDDIVLSQSLVGSDPFNIKDTVMQFLSTGNISYLTHLQKIIDDEMKKIINEIICLLFQTFAKSSLYNLWNQYKNILKSQPKLDSEELLYIEKIINENIGRSIKIDRDTENDNNFKLMLDNKDLIGLERKDMHLSTGEQNFISLAFALLLARHSQQEFVILDDPISSFDSVYKNKIAFCIVKFLEDKKQIVLTHNTDLIRLLNVQLKDSFNLYILNNTDEGRNGFINVKKEEMQMLINLSDLVGFFQNKSQNLEANILDKKLFLMSMIPFLRGYIHIMKDPEDDYGKLSRIMHGYECGALDVNQLYIKAFGYDLGVKENVSVQDILNISIDDINIINSNEYPLLSDTLKQTLIYYHIRMKVEHELCDIFNIKHSNNKNLLLTDIICRAFASKQNCNEEQLEKMRDNRVFFTSRKTLLNEFNHFEGNMNIFQPAIDIKESKLKKEIKDIEDKLKELREEYAQ